MTAKAYCDQIEQKDLHHKKLEPDFPIVDDGSPLKSLHDLGIPLIFEPSIMPAYSYLVREALIEKIQRIANLLIQQEKTLIIRSAWRSFVHQQMLREQKRTYLQKEHPALSHKEINDLISYFIAPMKKSTHATGGAVDALIFDDRTQSVLDFGSNKGYDIDLNTRCYPHHPNISDQAKKNRALLIDLFENEGFVCDLKEFWHFDYGNVGWAIEKGKSEAIYGIIGQEL